MHSTTMLESTSITGKVLINDNDGKLLDEILLEFIIDEIDIFGSSADTKYQSI